MHLIVVSTCEYIHLIGVLTVLAGLKWRHLQIEKIEHTQVIVRLLQMDVLMEVVMYAQVLDEVLWFAQVPHLHIQVVSARQQRWARMLDKACARDRIHDLREHVRLWLVVLDLALHGSLHFCRLAQVVDLHVALRRGQQELTWLGRVELAVRDYLVHLKYFLWRLLNHFVVHVAALSRLSIPIWPRAGRPLDVPHGDGWVIGRDERLTVGTLWDRIDVELMNVSQRSLDFYQVSRLKVVHSTTVYLASCRARYRITWWAKRLLIHLERSLMLIFCSCWHDCSLLFLLCGKMRVIGRGSGEDNLAVGMQESLYKRRLLVLESVSILLIT